MYIPWLKSNFGALSNWISSFSILPKAELASNIKEGSA
jgi:hypothetical protein